MTKQEFQKLANDITEMVLWKIASLQAAIKARQADPKASLTEAILKSKAPVPEKPATPPEFIDLKKQEAIKKTRADNDAQWEGRP